MITSNLRNLFAVRNIQKPRAWLIKQGITPQVADRLLRNDQRHLRFDDIEKICLGLNCAPTDIFIWEPDSPAQDIPNHPLQAIRSNRILPDIVNQLNSTSLEELKLVSDYISKLKEGK